MAATGMVSNLLWSSFKLKVQVDIGSRSMLLSMSVSTSVLTLFVSSPRSIMFKLIMGSIWVEVAVLALPSTRFAASILVDVAVSALAFGAEARCLDIGIKVEPIEPEDQELTNQELQKDKEDEILRN